LCFDGRREQYAGNRQPQDAIHLKPPSGQIVIDVSLHHACFAKGRVGTAEHVFGDFLGARTAGEQKSSACMSS
jgi:hypothetical protein